MSEEKERQIFSKNLNYYMQKNNKTQTDLIDDLKINKSTISTWCNGTKMPRMGKIQTLADYFGINKSDLVEEKPSLSDEYIAVQKYLKSSEIANISYECIEGNGAEGSIYVLTTQSGDRIQLTFSKLVSLSQHTAQFILMDLMEEHFRQKKAHLMPIAAHSNDSYTEEELQHDLDIMDDENF